MRDTIYAPATAAGRAAVAVVRVSGSGAADVARALCGRLPQARRATVASLQGQDGVIDEALVLWMPGPRSFTGEDTVEFQTHGGRAIVEAVCQAIATTGARLADAGEFTRRAFEAGRLDLTQAEAIADLVDAETQAQRRQALAQFGGALSDRYARWRETLLDGLAMVEACIDFPEDDVPDGAVATARRLFEAVGREIAAELENPYGEQIRNGLYIAIVGAPNVGKSSIFNALSGQDVAIVTPIPGTTRDVLESHLVIEGHVAIIVDTAGQRDTVDPIELIGVGRARDRADRADLRVAVGDASRPETIAAAASMMNADDFLVVNKTDLDDEAWRSKWPTALSVDTRERGIGELWLKLSQWIKASSGGRDFPAITRQRHRHLLEEAVGYLGSIGKMQTLPAELVGEDVRMALRSLERIAGRTDPEDILDRVFTRFCIGK